MNVKKIQLYFLPDASWWGTNLSSFSYIWFKKLIPTNEEQF